VNNQDELASLARWNVSGAELEHAYTRMSAHPRFSDAVRVFASNFLEAGDKDKALGGIFKDAGHYVAAMIAIYLHLTGGLTLPRLKELCVSSGFVSPGRARALLLYLQYLGYVELFPVRAGRHASRYIPSASFLSAWRNQLRAALGGALIVEPAAALILDRLDSAPVFELFAKIHAVGLLEAAPAEDNTARGRAILHRKAGSQIIWSLIVADEANAFPSGKAVSFSIAGAARRFGVSRVHVRRFLDAAAEEGLLRVEKDGGVVFEEFGRGTLALLYAGQLVQILRAAAMTLFEAPEIFTMPAPSPAREHPIAASGTATQLNLA
jgi:hypothetical protein